jgi:hypothetical protein
MNLSTLSQIEESINQLSVDQQLRLIERVAQRIRGHIAGKDSIEDQLAAMASDPQIQDELRKIGEEFASTEADGLEKV